MTKDPTEGKMAPKWEGPYKVVGCHQKGAYRPMTEIMERRALEEILYVILCFFSTILYSIKKISFQFISTIVEIARLPPSNDLKELWGDTQKRIHLHLFLGQPERVMERMQWEETPRLGVTKGITLRMPDSFPRTTRKGYGRISRQETS
jgi:hypothetical protein